MREDNNIKNIKYLNKNFNQYKKSLIEFAKSYFPDVYNDFNESSPGMMFIEMASYIGDVLSYYIDKQHKESLLPYAQNPKNIYNIANVLGYNPHNVKSSITEDLDVFQIVPAKGTGDNASPDYSYAMNIDAGMAIRSENNSNIEFRTSDIVDFSFSSSFDPTHVNIYQVNEETNDPEFYLLRKKTKAKSGRLFSKNYTFNEPKTYDKIILDEENVIDIESIKDSDGNTWYEVPYLAQSLIIQDVRNIETNDPELYINKTETPYLLKTFRTSRRFVKKLNANNKFEIQFGSGISSMTDEEIIPNPDNVDSGFDFSSKNTSPSIDPTNFLYTRTYGLAPSGTTLTVNYLVGNGVKDNVESDSLTEIIDKSFNFVGVNLDSDLEDTVENSLAVVNKSATFGGKSKENPEEIKENALANFSSQNRTVTRDDFIIRSYSMPPKYGSIAKSYIINSTEVDIDTQNPYSMDLYVLSYNQDKQLTQANQAIKENLKNYLLINKMLTDHIIIKDAYIVNIGVDFEIIILSGYNKNEVLMSCVDEIRKFFDIEKWKINEPIFKSKILTNLNLIEGVQSVNELNIYNKYGGDYSSVYYDVSNAEIKSVIYPPKNPSIFELKYKNKDIRGRVTSY